VSRGEPVNGFEILTKLAVLPVSTWRYEWEPASVRHLGPMAQDWKATFGLGDTDTTIPHVDANGVLLVAVQALVRQVQELRGQVAVLDQRIGELTAAQLIPPAGG
jgi:hypothetical protein